MTSRGSSPESSRAFSLEGKRALVTGGGTGIGLAISQEMAEAGAQVIICGRREHPLKEAASAIGASARYYVQDLAKLVAIPEFVQRITDECGPVDILVNNAGVNLKRGLSETSDSEFAEVIGIDLLSVFSLTRECAREMTKRKEGAVIMLLSMASLFGIPQVSAYTAAKSALAGLIRQLATELSPLGVTVNGVAPGWIDTAMSRKAFEGDPDRLNKVLSRTPAGRLGTPEEIAHAVRFLASPAARFITGAILPVDGGASIGF